MNNESLYIQKDSSGNILLPNIKKIFLPDKDMEILDGDLCLTEDHEVLTTNGWVNIRSLVETKLDCLVACWDADTAKILWHKPIEYIEQIYTGKIYEFVGKVSIKGTANHKQPMMSNFGKFRKVKFSDLATAQGASNRYIHSGLVENTNTCYKDYLKLLVATQADGCFPYRKSSYLRFSFKKDRKRVRLEEILNSLNCSFYRRDQLDGYTHYYVTANNPISQQLLKDLGRRKTLPNWLLQLNVEQINLVVEELQFWDGKHEKLDNFSYFSQIKENIDLVQGLCALCGRYSAVDVSSTGCYSVYISHKVLSQDRTTVRNILETIEVVYCITVPTNYFVCRRNNKVCITGNSGADAMVYGRDSDCKALNDFFENPKKFHPSGKLYAWVASEHLQKTIMPEDEAYKPYKASHHGCVTGDHEVLTHKGWIRIDAYNSSLPLAVWDMSTGEIHFEIPKDFNEDWVNCDEPLVMFKGTTYSQVTTLDHKFPVWSNSTFKIKEANDVTKSAKLPYSGQYKGGIKVEPLDKIRLIAALQADGCVETINLTEDAIFSFRFIRQRKIERLEAILQNLPITYKKRIFEEKPGKVVTEFKFKGYLKAWMKKLDWWVLDYSRECLDAFMEELLYWNGCFTSRQQITIASTDRLASEIMQTLYHLSGKASKIWFSRVNDEVRKPLYTISINNRKFFNVSTGNVELVAHEGTKVYCPQTTTGFFLVRRNGHISITGNTWYGMQTKKLAATINCSESFAKILMEFYDYIYPEKALWHNRLREEVKAKGYITNKFGRRFWFLDTTDPTRDNKMFSAIPQSTVADVINRGWVRIKKELSQTNILMQVHDSLVIQYPIGVAEEYRKRIKECMEIPIPYDPVLVIPSDFKVSRKSYGEVEKVKA